MNIVPHDRRLPDPTNPRSGSGLSLRKLDKAYAEWLEEVRPIARFQFSEMDTIRFCLTLGRNFTAEDVTPTMVESVQKANPGFPENQVKDFLVRGARMLRLDATLRYLRWQPPLHEVRLRQDLRPHYLTITTGKETRQLDLERFISRPPVEQASGTRFTSTGRGGKKLVLTGRLQTQIDQEALQEENHKRTTAAREARRGE